MVQHLIINILCIVYRVIGMAFMLQWPQGDGAGRGAAEEHAERSHEGGELTDMRGIT